MRYVFLAGVAADSGALRWLPALALLVPSVTGCGVSAVARQTAGKLRMPVVVVASGGTPALPEPVPAAPAQVASASCSKDTDCKGDRICVAGQCTSPPSQPAAPAVVAPSAPAPAPPTPAASSACRDGKVISDETRGHCCWDGQAWNGVRCVGVPNSCPAGLDVDANKQDCVVAACPSGQVRAAGTIHCCWPGQGWSKSRDVCIGVPAVCPQYYTKTAEGCDPIPADQVRETRCKANDGDACMLIAAGISEQTEHDRYLTLACQAGTKAGCDELQREKDAQAAAAIAAQQAAQAAALKAEEDAKLQAQQEQERQRKEAEDRRQRAIREQREREEAERRAAEQEAAAKQAAIEGTANRRTSGFVLTAVGAGLGATSVVFMGLGAAKNSAIRGGGYANASAISSAASAGATFNKVAWVTGITGVIGITVGGGLVIFNPPPSTASSASAAGRLPGLSFVRSW